MLGSMPSKGNVQQAARYAVANVSEYGRAFEGGAGRDIRMEGFANVSQAGRGGTGVITPVAPRKLAPFVILALVVLLAS